MTHPDYIISVSYGNDSLAMIQWAHETSLDAFGSVFVVFCDTGWSAPGWAKRVALGEQFAARLGFHTKNLKSIGMEELVSIKKGWPGNGQQFCTAHLKGVPYLDWLDDVDPQRTSITLVGKRRAESLKRADTPEWIDKSEYHGDRRLWHPLYLHTDEERDALLERAGIPMLPTELIGESFEKHDRLYRLPHRSMECSPCVNANRSDFLRLSAFEINRVSKLEVQIGKPMFRPKRFNGVGIYGVMMWAKFGKDSDAEIPDDEGCGSAFGCGY